MDKWSLVQLTERLKEAFNSRKCNYFKNIGSLKILNNLVKEGTKAPKRSWGKDSEDYTEIKADYTRLKK